MYYMNKRKEVIMFKNINLDGLNTRELQILFKAIDDYYFNNEHHKNYFTDEERVGINNFIDKIIDIKNSKTTL